MAKELVGRISHYYPKIGVAVVEVSGSLKKGEKVSIEGASTDVHQAVGSMQVDHKEVESAKKGDSVGMKVSGKVRENDNVYLE